MHATVMRIVVIFLDTLYPHPDSVKTHPIFGLPSSCVLWKLQADAPDA